MKRCICEKFGGKIIVQKAECPVNHRLSLENEEPMKRCTKTNVIKTSDNRELCPVCGTDVTIIRTHEPCTMTFGKGMLWYSAPIQYRNLIDDRPKKRGKV